MIYQLGCRPDKPDSRDRHYASLRLGVTPPPAWSLKDKVVEVLDQASTSACVAHAWAQALRIMDKVEGLSDPPLASRFFIYFGARKFDGGGGAIVDEGTQLRSAAQAIMTVGRPPESAWSFDLAKVNTPPPWEAFREAYDCAGPGGYYRLTGTDQMKEAIANNKPVVGGAQVGQSIMDYQGGIYDPDPNEPKIGGHALCFTSYDLECFTIVNSWGVGYGERGFIRVSPRYAASFTDVWAVH